MPAHRPSSRAVLARAGNGWKKRVGGQATNWLIGMKNLALILVSVVSVHPAGWGPRDEDCSWWSDSTEPK